MNDLKNYSIQGDLSHTPYGGILYDDAEGTVCNRLLLGHSCICVCVCVQAWCCKITLKS